MPTTKHRRVRLYCDQCEMLSINGVPCHEQGCPNGLKLTRAASADAVWSKAKRAVTCNHYTQTSKFWQFSYQFYATNTKQIA